MIKINSDNGTPQFLEHILKAGLFRVRTKPSKADAIGASAA
jgi:hypothetical protein